MYDRSYMIVAGKYTPYLFQEIDLEKGATGGIFHGLDCLSPFFWVGLDVMVPPMYLRGKR